MKASARAEDPVAYTGGASPVSGNSGVIELLDGTRIPYRPIRPEDVAALQRFHRHLSEHSVYVRFFGAMLELSDRKADYFTNVDSVNRFALAALDPKRPEESIGIVSFYREGSTDRAEYAAAVEDRGLGLALTRALIAAALRRNIRVFTAMVLPENARMLNLLRDLKLPERLRYEDGAELVEIELLPEDPGYRENH